MTTLDDVLSQLQPEEVPQDINFNAPEPGAFAPAFKPSTQTFVFHLPEDQDRQFEVVTIQNRKWLQCNFNVTVNVDGTDRKVMFQRANTFKTDKMDNSSIGNLIRSMELKEAYEQNLAETGDVNAAIVRTLQAADGRAAGSADFGWSAAFKDSLTIFSTKTNKTIPAKASGKYTTQPWPRDAQGAYCATVADPASGQEKYPNLEIVRFRIAKPSMVTA
jgi:hypothetical protein